MPVLKYCKICGDLDCCEPHDNEVFCIQCGAKIYEPKKEEIICSTCECENRG